VDCRTRATSPQSVPGTAPAPGGPTPRPARARRGNLAGQLQLSPGPRPGTSLTLPGSIRARPGHVWRTRLGGPGSADQTAEPGTRARATVQSGSSQAISQGSHGSALDAGQGRPSLSRTPSGSGPGTRGIPGSADPGGRTWDQSSNGRPVSIESSPDSPGPAGPPSGQEIPSRLRPATLQGRTRKTGRRRARQPPWAAARCSVGDGRHGPTVPGTVSRPCAHTIALPVSKLEPSKPGPGPAARRDSTTALQAQRTRSTRITSPRCNSDQAQSVKFEPPLLSNVTRFVTHGLGGI
jgi:hypothetical protein